MSEWAVASRPDRVVLLALDVDGAPVEGLAPAWLDGSIGWAIVEESPGIHAVSLGTAPGETFRGVVDMGDHAALHRRYRHILHVNTSRGFFSVALSSSPTEVM